MAKASKHTSQLRIIGGQWRGRKLSIPDIDGLRPTGDRIRETLFNWLAADIPESTCLDLFSGSGALALECLSRGAAHVTLLEQHPQAYRTLKQHCHTLQTKHADVIEADCLAWLEQTKVEPHSIDIAFIDPPFSLDLWQRTIDLLAQSQLLKNNARVYVETPRNTLLHTPASWTLHKEKQAGQVCYRLFDYCEVT